MRHCVHTNGQQLCNCACSGDFCVASLSNRQIWIDVPACGSTLFARVETSKGQISLTREFLLQAALARQFRSRFEQTP
ncbi:MAG TPA: hypothetical protein DCZ49_07450 [Hyphomonadaceae bacterium]|nr:hypothetical protein [Hyphomonadaceae bacterium]